MASCVHALYIAGVITLLISILCSIVSTSFTYSFMGKLSTLIVVVTEYVEAFTRTWQSHHAGACWHTRARGEQAGY